MDIMAPAARRAGRARAAAARAAIVLVTLTFVYVLNFLDRQLLGILAKPIQDSLHITDGQLGLIGGLYFAFFYCFIAIPVGWFADRTNRVTVVSLACAIWSGGDDRVRARGDLSAARRGADDGRLRRGGRRAAVLCDHHRHLSARASAAPRSASTISGRRSARRWASRSAPRSPPRSTGARRSSRSASIGVVTAIVVRLLIREPARGALDPVRDARRRPARRRSGRRSACSSPIRCCCSPRSAAARRSSSPTASAISRCCS